MTEASTALLVVNTRHPAAIDVATQVFQALRDASVQVVVAQDDADAGFAPQGATLVPADEHAGDGCDVAVVLGGDGTILRAAERVRAAGVPLIGVNLGHVGFLAEAEREDLDFVVASLVARRWQVEERMALEIIVISGDEEIGRTWALNEVSIEKLARQRMIDLVLAVDDRPLSRWGCDGVVVATPTGSTAYAFSAGGPVIWPEVAALCVVPLSAHALFARPLVVSPRSVIAIELQPGSDAVLWADGRRMIEVRGPVRIEARQAERPVRLARLVDAPFTNRLVAKFALPVDGWRG
jgi:NAD+ kinase